MSLGQLLNFIVLSFYVFTFFYILKLFCALLFLFYILSYHSIVFVDIIMLFNTLNMVILSGLILDFSLNCWLFFSAAQELHGTETKQQRVGLFFLWDTIKKVVLCVEFMGNEPKLVLLCIYT